MESYLRNVGPYNIRLTGGGMAWNGDWHNALQDQMAGHIFAYYSWSGNTSPVLYNPPDTGIYPYSHVFSSSYNLSAGTTNWFKWAYVSPFRFWNTPNFRSYPLPDAGDPTRALTISPPAPNTSMLWYWPSDFTGHVDYDVVPATGPTISCSQNMSGREGPSIEIIYSSNPINSSFYIRARTNGNDFNTQYVYFYVYDSAGNLVSWSSDSTAPYCIFGGGCTSRAPFTGRWSQGGSLAYNIENGDYTLVVLAVNNDARRKANVVTSTFSITAITPTPTLTRTITRTPTVTRTPTITQTPTITPNTDHHADADTDIHHHSNTDDHTYTDCDTDTDQNPNIHCDPDADGDTHANDYIYNYVDNHDITDGDQHAHADAHPHADTDDHQDTYSDQYGRPDAYTDGVPDP